ncbi:MAG: hypothetical protein ABFQ95_01970 [Pseudomonadota bacterium]
MNQTIQDKLLKIALEDIVQYGWGGLNLCRVAKTARLSFDELYQVFPTKGDVLQALIRKIDHASLAQIESFADEEKVQSRLFAIVMDRFDVMQEYKPVLQVLWRDLWKDPLFFLCQAPHSFNSMRWVLEASGVETASLLGSVRVKIFTGFYLSVVHTWLSDNTTDMAETMAALDQGLKRLEQIPGFYDSDN